MISRDQGVVNQGSRITAWSLITLAAGVPVWLIVIRSSVLSRVVDGGIWISVASGISSGLKPYSEVWDHKDPLFYMMMVLASAAHPVLMFFLDIFWIALGALGVGLMARSVMSRDKAIFLGVVVTPLLMLGPAYVPGWTNTPGTALTLLALGLFSARLGIGAGLVAGLLAFVKLPIWPIVVVGLLAPLFFSGFRREAKRSLLAMAGSVGIIGFLLLLLGWLSGWVAATSYNRSYATDIASYFGFEPGLLGRWERVLGDWPDSLLWGAASGASVVLVALIIWIAVPSLRTDRRLLLGTWAIIAWAGTAVVLGLTYVWPHHVQALALPTILSAVVFAALIPQRWPFIIWLAVTALGGWLLSGWGSLEAWQQKWSERSATFDTKVLEISEAPIDARLLNSVPLREFSFARLGSNDDRGFLGSVREDATLGCPQFHLYDFSPPEAFADALSCIQGVDVVLVTDAFMVFGSSSRAPFATPVLDYVTANFTCLRVEDRQVCTRNRQ